MTPAAERQSTPRRWAERACRWCVAAVMVGAAVAKWSDFAVFVKTIGDFGLVLPGWELPTAILISALEILAGGWLLFRRPSGVWLTGALLVGFTAVIGYGMWLGLDIECGCLGPAGRWAGVTLKMSLLRNLLLLAALAFVWHEARGGD